MSNGMAPMESANDHHLGWPREDSEYAMHQHPLMGWIREYSDGRREPIEDLAQAAR